MKQNTLNTDQIVAEFSHHGKVDDAVAELINGKIDSKNISVIGQDYHTEEQPVGFINTGDRMHAWGKLGMFWGSLWGLLFGSAVIFIPGAGGVVFAGWLAMTLLSGVEGAVIGGGAAAIGAALVSIGIKKDSAVEYEKKVMAGTFLVIVRGTPTDIEFAKSVFVAQEGEGLEISSHRNNTPVA